MNQLAIDFHARVHTARSLGREAGKQGLSKAEQACPGFTESALNFIADYARQHETFRGEECTNAMKLAGIRSTDDRHVGPIYKKAAALNLIHIVGYVPRVRGHGAMDGKRYAQGAAQLAGKDVEIAMALGDRDAAYRAMREMNAQTVARQAAREACYFCEMGDADRAALGAAAA